MIIKFKKTIESATIPIKAHESDAGFDLVATSFNKTDKYFEYSTNICVEIPLNCVGMLFPRSSISKKDLSLANSVGIIDSGYRGEIKCRFKISARTASHIDPNFPEIYAIGDKIAQLIIIPLPNPIVFEEVTELSNSDRESGGFGSTDIKK